MIARLAVVIALLALAGTTAQTNAPKDWVSVIARTPEGGMRMGNPDAAVKLVNYCSPSSPTCAVFARDSGRLRSQHIASGRVSFEYRDMPIHPQDEAIILLRQCMPDRDFFPVIDHLFAELPALNQRIALYPNARYDEVRTLAEPERSRTLVDDLGYTEIMKQHGLTDAKITECLGDARGRETLKARYDDAIMLGVDGTPTFFVNGKRVFAIRWSQLEPLLIEAGA